MIELKIDDRTCGGCVASITRVVKALDPDAAVNADVATKRVNITSAIDTDAVLTAIANAGYHPQAL
jgi:copper chaperone